MQTIESRSTAATKKIDWVETESGCWECISHKPNKQGYPTRKAHGDRCHLMARWMYGECFGDPGAGLVVRHKCDNKLCINPEHLETGTHLDNYHDRKRADSFGKKLKNKDVEYIRNNYRAGNKWHPGNVKSLASMFSITVNTVRRINNGWAWT